MGSRCIRGSSEETTKPRCGIGKDYQEIHGQTAGDGCKQTPAWRATLTRSQLDAKRAEFWASRCTGSRHVWLTIRQAVEADHETAALLLQMAGISMPEGKISLCVDPTGHIYEVPAFVINEPSAYSQEVVKPLPKPQLVYETVTIKLRCMGVERDAAITVDTRETIAKLKTNRINGKGGCDRFFNRFFIFLGQVFKG